MKINSTLGKSFAVLSFCSLISACTYTITPLKPAAENVKITNQTAPQSCRLIGTVGSKIENGRAQAFTSREDLKINETNVLRNQALQLDANLVVVTTHKTIFGNYSAAKEVYSDTPTVKIPAWHVMYGDAYQCSENALLKVVSTTPSEIALTE